MAWKQTPMLLTVFLCALTFALALPQPSAFRDSLRFIQEARAKYRPLGKNPEVDMNTTQLIASKGYPVESHSVLTEDGYILGVFRMPHGLHNKDKKGPRPVVLLQHGLMASGDDWLLNSAEESLAYILADAGADVWLGNSRGNIYSRRHKSLSPHDKKFWKFGWDEMARYDLPATINYILSQTRQEQLYYVGHSQGTVMGFAQFGEDPSLGAKVKHFMAMAPVARVAHTKSPARFLAPFAAEIEFFLDIFGHGQFTIPPALMRAIAGTLCEKWGAAICENFMFVMCGFDYKSLNASRMDVYIAHDPAGTSGQVLLQWAQSIRSGQFQHFDYGAKENMVKYGQKTPPLYDPKKVKVPVAIFRGGRDWLADEEDIKWLMPQLNVTHDINIPFYEHLDMTLAFDAHIRLYQEVVKIVMGGVA